MPEDTFLHSTAQRVTFEEALFLRFITNPWLPEKVRSIVEFVVVRWKLRILVIVMVSEYWIDLYPREVTFQQFSYAPDHLDIYVGAEIFCAYMGDIVSVI